MDFKMLINIQKNSIINKIKVNYTFLHIVNQKNLKIRLHKRKSLNRYDKFNYSFYKKVQKGFIKQAKLKNKKYSLSNLHLSGWILYTIFLHFFTTNNLPFSIFNIGFEYFVGFENNNWSFNKIKYRGININIMLNPE